MMHVGDNLAQLAWTQLWQATLVVLVVAAVVRLTARTRPHLAYLLWGVVLLKCLTPPVASLAGSRASQVRGAQQPSNLPFLADAEAFEAARESCAGRCGCKVSLPRLTNCPVLSTEKVLSDDEFVANPHSPITHLAG